MTKIKSVAKLKKLASVEGGLNCFLALAGGAIRSSKHISYDLDGIFYVENEIDDSEQELSEAMLWTHSNIGEAMDKGCLIAY